MKSEGAKLRAAREADYRRRDQATLKRLAERLKHAKHERTHAARQIRHYCRLARQNVNARIKRLREEQRAAINAKAERLRRAQAEQCQADQDAARAELDQAVREAHAELELERSSFRKQYGKKKSRTTRAERRQEDDQEVEHNLPPELVAVWRSVKSSIRGSDRISRTEKFLQWVEENPDAVQAVVNEAVERDVAKLVAEHSRVKARLRKGKKAYRDPDEVAHALAGVPF